MAGRMARAGSEWTARIAALGLLTLAVGAQDAPKALYLPHRWALVVGASEYEHLGRLKYARNDARAFAEALVTDLGFERQTVRLLSDDADDPELTPTAGHLLGELEALLADKRRNRSDLFVFYFCGHGVGREGGDYLLPTDARKETVTRVGLPVKEVIDRLAGSGMRNVLVLVDACREGRENPFGRDLYELADRARLAVVLGCEPGGQSYEEATLGQGAFTHFLIEALRDDQLYDPLSGALWASRVAATTAERVLAWSRGREPPQHPVVWNDPTRDVLLGAARSQDDVHAFIAGLEQLAPEAHRAALGSYAESLYRQGRVPECIAVLKAAEQLGPLEPEHLLRLGTAALERGRAIEAARAFAEVRARDPDSVRGWMATVLDWSGAATNEERARAAHELWLAGERDPPDLLLAMVSCALEGAQDAGGLTMAEAALAATAPDTRAAAFLQGARDTFLGRDDDALRAFERAGGLPGDFPEDRALIVHRMYLLQRSRGDAAIVELLDGCIAREPDFGRWYASRAWARRQAEGDPELVLADVRAALALPLAPDSLLDIVRAAGARVGEFADAIVQRAEEHPLAWEAQLAVLFARPPPEVEEALARIARLAARATDVYVEYAYLVYRDAFERDFVASRSGAAPEDSVLRIEAMQRMIELLAPRAQDFGDDAGPWRLLASFYQRSGEFEALARLLERHLGATAEAGRLPPDVVEIYALACLDAGRMERLGQLRRSLHPDSIEADSLVWWTAAFAAVFDETELARDLLGERLVPRDHELLGLGASLRAVLLARAGKTDEARALLPEEDPFDTLTLALTGFAARALGDTARERRIAGALEGANFRPGYFAALAFWLTDPATEPLVFLLETVVHLPGNPLLAGRGFASGAELYEGPYDYTLEQAPGPLAAAGAELILSVLPGGRVMGTLVLSPQEALVIQGRVDENGNLEAQCARPGGALTFLAKLAPPMLFPMLAENGLSQSFLVLDADGVPLHWSAHPRD